MRPSIVRTFALVPAIALGATTARAQDAAKPTICHPQSCAIVFDWGGGKTSSSYGADIRYGSGDDFEIRLRATLAENGLITRDPPASGPIVLTVRPQMNAKAMCDQMSGLGTKYNCTAMSNVSISFNSSDAAVKAPNSMRVNNRCGAGDIFMTNQVFAKFVGDLVFWTLEGQDKKAPRPSARC